MILRDYIIFATMSSIQNSGANFSSVPILDYSLIDSPTTRPQFILQLQHSLINVGFLYLKNHRVDNHIILSHLVHPPTLRSSPGRERQNSDGELGALFGIS
jgi:hypothetical protein